MKSLSLAIFLLITVTLISTFPVSFQNHSQAKETDQLICLFLANIELERLLRQDHRYLENPCFSFDFDNDCWYYDFHDPSFPQENILATIQYGADNSITIFLYPPIESSLTYISFRISTFADGALIRGTSADYSTHIYKKIPLKFRKKSLLANNS